MSFRAHPPTQICDGAINPDEPDKPRVLLTNPETGKGSVHSTDQTARGKPEWIFPRCPANMDYMLGCSLIITEHDEQNKSPPADCSVFSRDMYGDGDEAYTFAVRRHTSGDIKEFLERAYFHKECTYGIVVVVPCNPMIAKMVATQRVDPMLAAMSGKTTFDEDEMVRQPLDQTLRRYLAEQEDSIQRALHSFMQQQQQNNGGE